VIPGLHEKEDILEIAKSIKGAKKYFIQNFVAQNTLDPEFMKIKSFPKNKLEEFAKIAKPHVLDVKIR
jgi:pyruvate formate lyase activating enzyme